MLNKREQDLKQAKFRLQQVESKTHRIDELEKQIFELKNSHAVEINKLIVQLNQFKSENTKRGGKRDSSHLFSPTDQLSIELENLDKRQISKETNNGMNTVKVASNTFKVSKGNHNATSVRNSNSALDYRHPEDFKFVNPQLSAKMYPTDMLG